ncbi:MAG: vWA domain-containing protein [Acidimicrobiales bacterium]
MAELRAVGLPVSLTEDLDALAALGHLDLGDRGAFRSALAATLVKSAAHLPTFDAVFEVFFALPAAGDRAGYATDDVDLAALVEEVLATGDERARSTLAPRLAAEAVRRLAGMEAGRPLTGGYYLHRTLRALDIEGVLERLLAAVQDSGDGSAFEVRLIADDLRLRAAAVRSGIEAEIRRRLAAERGTAALARAVRRPLPEDVDFLHAAGDDLVAVRRALQPLSRRLAARLARRRRRHRAGPLDFRATVRHSLSSAGVPVELRHRRAHPTKPEIVVIADISGSVASFARFTLQLVHALAGEFGRVRSFVFIDGVDEVTHMFDGAAEIADALRRVNTEADVVWADGHSDYGHALSSFWVRWGSEVGPRTTVLILGDARNNYHAPEAWAVAELARRARRVYWLNPEPRSYWDTGDSIVSQYAAHCHGAFECRNLRQLQKVVERVG